MNIAAFNVAMLAKQGWRILSEPDSLLTRTLKARYFPRGSFFEATKSYCPSFSWQNIISARDVLKKGLSWRVGNGDSIRIWQDRWLPDDTNFLFPLSRQVVDLDQPVNSLMNDDRSAWKVSTILRTFPNQIARQILAIPLSVRRIEDSWRWHFTKSGFFSVKSTYHLACNLSQYTLHQGPSFGT